MAITRVQGNARAAGLGTTLTVTQNSPPTNGNLNILAFCSTVTEFESGSYVTRSVSSITQTGVTWTKQAFQDTWWEHPANHLNTLNSEIWVGVVGAGASATITLTLLGTGDTNNAEVANVCEYSGLLTSGFLDKTAINAGESTNTDTGTTAITSQANELWIGAIAAERAQTTPTNGFTLLDGVYYTGYGISNAYLEKIVSATGTANSGTSIASIENWVGCIVTLKAPAVAAVVTYGDGLTWQSM